MYKKRSENQRAKSHENRAETHARPIAFSRIFAAMERKGKLLIIDDNEDVLFALNLLLEPYVEKIKVATRPDRIEHFMRTFRPDVILLDMNFERDAVSGEEGFEWLERILDIDPRAVVVFMTAYSDTEKAVRAIKAGATDFVSKPWVTEKLLATLSSAIRLSATRREVGRLREQVDALRAGTADAPPELIGESPAMRTIQDTIAKLASTDANILITGENGTGKDLVARLLRDHSPRRDDVFVTIDLGSVSESLFESELFGYEKGAFTDARKAKPGRLESASGGTLFLDEIGNLSLSMQAKLLTAIEKRYIVRLGSVEPIPIDVRLICATNANLRQRVAEGAFRQDLLYRINTIELAIPPLRERGNDIRLLADHFLRLYAHKYKKPLRGITSEAAAKLTRYPWPGNVRELQHVIERAVILSEGPWLRPNDFPLYTTARERKPDEESTELNLERLERAAIERALKQSQGNMTYAAELLGITRFSLYRKLEKLGL